MSLFLDKISNLAQGDQYDNSTSQCKETSGSMKNSTLYQGEIDVEGLLQPETSLELKLLENKAFRQGLFWGKPRYGHPEGKIVFHIREILDNIERLNVTDEIRQQLRTITFAHDTFKYLEAKSDYRKHHAFLARQFMEDYHTESAVLDVIELHDEAYYSWRHLFMYEQPDRGHSRLENLLQRLGPNRQLFYLFFKCDTRTGDKNQAPLHWFEADIPHIDLVDF